MPARVRVEWMPGPLTRSVKFKVDEALDDASDDLADEIRRLISKPGGGIASKPGEPPRLQTGELHESIEIRKTKDGRLVGSPLVKAFWLERGTQQFEFSEGEIETDFGGIEPRPFLRPALANARRQMLGRFKK